VAVVIRELSPEQRLAVQLVENIDREALTVLEESAAVVRLIEFGRKPKDVAGMLGKTPAWVSLRRKIADHRSSLEYFVAEERTRDAETLAMLVDLEKVDARAFNDMHRVERITRAAVRDALERAKERKLAPVAPAHVPEVPVLEPADPSARPDARGDAPQDMPEGSRGPEGASAPAAPPRKARLRAVPSELDRPAGVSLAERYEEVRRVVETSLGMRVQVVHNEQGEGGQLRIDFADWDDLDVLRKALS
jgi:ParB family chromosome partitioning protein